MTSFLPKGTGVNTWLDPQQVIRQKRSQVTRGGDTTAQGQPQEALETSERNLRKIVERLLKINHHTFRYHRKKLRDE